MKTTPIFAWAAIIALAAAPVGADAPTYPCFRADQAPTIDGAGDDACWAHSPLATGFSILGDGFTDDKQTAFRMCYDDSATYILVTAEEPDVGHLKTGVRDGGPGWLNDGVEIFLQPGGRGQVYQFVVTAAAAVTSGAGTADFRQVDAASATGDASYTLEVAIPHDLVKAQPEAGDAWRGNVCRNVWTTNSGGDKFTCWAPLERQFLEPENYATLDMRGDAPPEDDVRSLTQELNERYREYLLAEVEQLLERAPEYRPYLEKARESEELGSAARRLLYRWYRLERMQLESDRFSIQQLRDVVESAEELLSASYDIKYAWLIDGLFAD